MPLGVFVYVWEFEVASEHAAAFESAYGPDGEWARLFGQDPGYLGTDLLRDRDRPGRYLTIDHWLAAAVREAFREVRRDELAELDARCAGLTEAERPLGEFDVVDRAPAASLD